MELPRCVLSYTCMATPCWGPTDPHHPKHRKSGAHLKPDDSTAFPLCRRHHSELHSLQGFFFGWTRYRLKAWQDEQSTEHGGLITDRPKRKASKRKIPSRPFQKGRGFRT
jgi:hypothetical protein